VHDQSGGSAELSWIDLGHADNSSIQKSIESGVTFSDISTAIAPESDSSCKDGFTSISTTDSYECLQLKGGTETLASRVEARRYAAMKGATTEFRKEEGVAFDPTSSTLYVAMSEIAKGMEYKL
jgi:hypothetical protein